MHEEEGGLHQKVRLAAIIAGPVLAILTYRLIPASSGLSEGGRGACAVAALMGVWWLTEALPLAATSLLPIVLFPILQVTSLRAAAAPYGNEVVFLFMGGFMIQQAMERWGLHQRLALATMLAVGTRPRRLVLGVMVAAGFLSMWISNAATAAMMLPIAVSIVRLVVLRKSGADTGLGGLPPDREVRNFAVCMMLAVAYAATIGGLATPVGTAPNLLGLAYMKDKLGVEVSFGGWMALCAPLAAGLLLTTWVVLTFLVYPVRMGEIAGGRALIKEEVRLLGPMKAGEKWTLGIFAATALLWVFREHACDLLGWYVQTPAGKREYLVGDAQVALMGALALFCIPLSVKKTEFVLDWQHASRLPFGVLLLFGGGLSLAEAFSATKVDQAIGGALGGLGNLPPLAVILVATGMIVFISEIVSNTALVAAFLPIMHGAATAVGIHPAVMIMPLTLGASAAFMLPAGTPPNAIVFSAGYLRITHMARAGLILNIISIVTVSLTVYWFGEWLLNVRM